ncbi:MAG: DedA family protein [Synechococcaceae cyanobacterium SM2_3_1]|nr:DedA family protein [Synechococcaceae cyanobacterium SM2_3_1]
MTFNELFQDLTWLWGEGADHWTHVIHQFGYGAVFLGVLIENTGIPVPGETITLTGGFLAGHEQLHYWGVWGAAVAGAILGDNLGYWLGTLGGWPLLVRIGKVFGQSEERLQSLITEAKSNIDQAVLLGRFLTFLRIFAGPLAGVAGMPYPRFLILNALGAVSWATVMVTLAYGAGRVLSLSSLLHHAGILALVALGAFLFYFWHSSRQRSSSPCSE